MIHLAAATETYLWYATLEARNFSVGNEGDWGADTVKWRGLPCTL